MAVRETWNAEKAAFDGRFGIAVSDDGRRTAVFAPFRLDPVRIVQSSVARRVPAVVGTSKRELFRRLSRQRIHAREEMPVWRENIARETFRGKRNAKHDVRKARTDADLGETDPAAVNVRTKSRKLGTRACGGPEIGTQGRPEWKSWPRERTKRRWSDRVRRGDTAGPGTEKNRRRTLTKRPCAV